MQAESGNYPDWRDAAGYAPLLDADPSLFAWEWLRRSPAYRAAASASGSAATPVADAASFGLVAFDSPQRAVPDARPMWTADVLPCVLRVAAKRTAPSDDEAVDLADFGDLARLVVAGDLEHLLLSDGLRVVRLDGPTGTFTSGPVRLRYEIAGLAAAEPPLLTLRRFIALCRSGRFARSLHPREARSRRWVLLLRASDALAVGADQRQIAEVLLGWSLSGPGWRTREPSARSRAQRLVRSARLFARGGYRVLLAGHVPAGLEAPASARDSS